MVDIDIDEWGGPDEIEELASGFADAGSDETGEFDASKFDTPPTGDIIEHEAGPPRQSLQAEMKSMAVRPDDPSELGYPPTLPVEVALQTASDDAIREAYGFTESQWRALWSSDQFKSDVTAARKMLSEEGMSFRAKARLQAEELLKTSWGLIHDKSGDVPPNVKADLLKFTIKAAGLEASSKDAAQSVTPLQINISL